MPEDLRSRNACGNGATQKTRAASPLAPGARAVDLLFHLLHESPALPRRVLLPAVDRDPASESPPTRGVGGPSFVILGSAADQAAPTISANFLRA